MNKYTDFPEQPRKMLDEEGEELSETGTGNISDTGTGESESDESTGEGVETGTDWDSIPSAIGEVWDATNDEGKPLTDAEVQEVKGEIQRAISLSEKLEIAMSGTGSSGGLGSADANQEVQVDWREQLNDLSTMLDALENLNRMHDFIGKDEIDSRLRWAAKNTADKINHLSNLNG